MDYNRLINFLINNELLSKKVFFAEQFVVTRHFRSNIIYTIKLNDSTKSDDSLFIKIKRNQENVTEKLLLREFVFYSLFQKTPLPFHFSEFPKVIENGIYQNNSIFIREFVVGYTSADKLLATSLETKIFIENIATKLWAFHNYTKKSQLKIIKSKFNDFFNESELKKKPLIISEIQPLSKFKFSPFFIQEFWKILNHKSIKTKLNNTIKKVFKDWKNDKVIHGDFRLANILFKDESNLTNHLFIDYELWHLGDFKWDIVCFIYDLEIFISKNNIKLPFDYIEVFMAKYDSKSNIDLVRGALVLLKLQNLYFDLEEANSKEKMTTLKNILNSI